VASVELSSNFAWYGSSFFLNNVFQQELLCRVSCHVMCNQRFAKRLVGLCKFTTQIMAWTEGRTPQRPLTRIFGHWAKIQYGISWILKYRPTNHLAVTLFSLIPARMCKVQKISVGVRSVLVPRIGKGVFQKSEDEPLSWCSCGSRCGSTRILSLLGPYTSD